MKSYNPERGPDPDAWLALDEWARMELVETAHAHVKLPNVRAHATIHTIAENQLAADDPAITRATLARLVAGGMTRHDAIHAIGRVILFTMQAMLQQSRE